MNGWTADFVNDPSDDYNIITEILYKDKYVAIIKKVKGNLEIKWYSHNEDLVIPFEWLLGLMEEAKRRIK